jgi:hypothetical protein
MVHEWWQQRFEMRAHGARVPGRAKHESLQTDVERKREIGASGGREVIEQPTRTLRHALEGKRTPPILSVALVVRGLEQHGGFAFSNGHIERVPCFLAEPRRLPVRLAERRNSDDGSDPEALPYPRGDFSDAPPHQAPPLLLLASPRDMRHEVNPMISQRCDQRLRQGRRKVCCTTLKAPSPEQSGHRIVPSSCVGLDR